MAVNLSPVGGVAAQFFTNNGVPLSGGKLYTYAAGTTTPLATYTSAGGGTAWTNPIVLDSGGRVPSGGEIWLTDGLSYKFILKDSNDVLIATYDNIIGINSNFVNYTNQQEIQTATSGQTIFTLATMQYQPGTGSLSVFVDGVNQYGPSASYAFQETDSTTVTFNTGLHVGASVKFTTSAINASSYGDASQIGFTGFAGQTGSVQDLAGNDGANWIGFEASGVGAIARSAQAKMRDVVSVKDFGATGDGITDDAAAIQAAITSLGSTGGTLLFPPGAYKVASTINANVPVVLDGSTPGSVYQPAQTAAVSLVWAGAVGGDVLRFGGFGALISGGGIVGIRITGSNTAANCLRIKDSQRGYFRNVTLTGATDNALLMENTGALADPTGFMIFDDLRIQLRGGATDNARGIYVNGSGTGVAGVTLCTFRRCRIDHANAAGVEVSNIGDFFYWESLQTFRADVETGNGVWFSGTSATAICGGHTFISPNISSGFRFDTPNVQTQTRIVNAGQIDINSGIQMLYGNGSGDVVMDTGLGFAYGQGLLDPIHAFSQRDNMALIRWDSANNVLHTAQGNWKTAVTAGGSIIESQQPGSATRLVTNAGLNDTAAIYDNATIGGGDGFSPATSFAGDFLVSLIQLTNEVVRFGFSDSTGDSPSNAVYVEFDPSVNANWRFVSTKAGVTTSVVSPLAGFVSKIEFYIFVEQFSNGVTCYYRTAGNRLFGLLGKITTNVPLLPMSTFARIKTTDANFKSFDVYGIKTAAVDEV